MIFLISVSTSFRERTKQQNCWICRHFAPDNIYPVGYDAQHHITGQGFHPWPLQRAGLACRLGRCFKMPAAFWGRHWRPAPLHSCSGQAALKDSSSGFSDGHFDQLILSAPFSLHGFPAPSRRRFPALPYGVIAVYPMQTVFQFSRCGAGFGNKKSPHNNLNLTIPSGMALVRVRYVAIES